MHTDYRNYQANPTALADKVIVVTGAGDGIGKQAATSYAGLGASVILLGKTVEKLERTYDAIKADGGNAAIIPIDFRGANRQHYHDMANTLLAEYGRVDGLLFNAGQLGNLCPFEQIKESEFEQVMQVNLNSQFLMTQAFLPALRAAKQASVVFTTSSVGRKARAFWGTYAISKFATEGMMQVLADEHKRSTIRFNCINPGATRTDMRAKAYPGEVASTLKTPADIMPAYLYLMSDDSASVNGESLDCQAK